ncbi:MAG: 5-formyltetrahydrofolate cyclo-ligase [Chthoniobacteraceae bacterium]
MPTKDELRLEMKQRVRALTPEFRALASEKICRAIALDDAWKSAPLVAAFLPLSSEPQIAPLLDRAAVCIPRVRGERCELVFLPKPFAHADWLLAGPEFDALPAIDPARLDLILVPGLAFTQDGLRLGRGGGVYDRLLAGCPARTRRIGVCFATQLVAALPAEPHDQRVERVITESSPFA